MSDDSISVSQARLRRGNARPGAFYSSSLSPEEAEEAQALEATFREAYDLDRAADELLLRHLCRAAVLAARAPSDLDSERGQNILGARVRLVADLCERLAVSRRERRKGADADEARHVATAAILAAIVKRSPSTAPEGGSA